MNARHNWSRILVMVGSAGLLVGALDPMEGSAIILPGSGLVALGAFLGPNDRRLIAYRVWAFILIAIGVGALWGLSSLGGIGGKSGRSMWWGVLILPYFFGWCLSIWGPGSPRWLLWLGIVVGLWYLGLAVMVSRASGRHHADTDVVTMSVIGAVGLLTIGGCITALVRRKAASSSQQGGSPPMEPNRDSGVVG